MDGEKAHPNGNGSQFLKNSVEAFGLYMLQYIDSANQISLLRTPVLWKNRVIWKVSLGSNSCFGEPLKQSLFSGPVIRN